MEPAFGATDVGMKRDHNEDYFSIKPEGNIYIVSDGMGGHNAGEVASLTAVERVDSCFTPELVSEMRSSRKDIGEEMVRAVNEAHRGVVELALTNTEYHGMGCTMVLAFINNSILHTCHVGDSRVYVINGEVIEQVTGDHSTVAELIRAGRMTKEEARYSILSGQLSQAIGGRFVSPEYNKRLLNKGDMVLLCTDGLWDMLDDAEICDVVKAGGTLEDICKRLIESANAAGGDDNITVVLINTDLI
jgi:protein phosphatase